MTSSSRAKAASTLSCLLCRWACEVVDWVRASPPEFGELLGTGFALVVTRSSGGRTQRQIHRVGAEHVHGVAVREDRFDSAAPRAEFVDLRCKVRAPFLRVQRPAAEW